MLDKSAEKWQLWKYSEGLVRSLSFCSQKPVLHLPMAPLGSSSSPSPQRGAVQLRTVCFPCGLELSWESWLHREDVGGWWCVCTRVCVCVCMFLFAERLTLNTCNTTITMCCCCCCKDFNFKLLFIKIKRLFIIAVFQKLRQLYGPALKVCNSGRHLRKTI